MTSTRDINGYDEDDEVFLYEESLLDDLDLESSGVTFNPPISIRRPGPRLKLRPLSSKDFDRGFMKLLEQLTKIGDVSKEDFLKRFYSMKELPGSYYVTVIEDTETNQVIGSASLVVERKFIRNCSMRGLLEDVVVSDQYRGKQLGKLIVLTVNLLARAVGCYKLTLNCTDQMMKFYSSLGYKAEDGNANFMQIRFPSSTT